MLFGSREAGYFREAAVYLSDHLRQVQLYRLMPYTATVRRALG